MPSRLCDHMPARYLAGPLLAAVLSSCGTDGVVAGGPTTGTEAGNAFSARVIHPDGSSARQARVVARLTESVNDSVRVAGVTDDNGRVELVLDSSARWTLEFAEARTAALRRIEPGSVRSIDRVVLENVASLAGKVVGGRPGDSVAIAGLGRRSLLGSDTGFAFDSLPAGRLSVEVLRAGASDTVSLVAGQRSTMKIVLVAADAPRIEFRSTGGMVRSGSLVSLDLPDPAGKGRATSWSDYRLLDADGASIPLRIQRRDASSGRTRVWIRSPASEADSVVRVRCVPAADLPPSSDPFRDTAVALAAFMTGSRTDSIPDLAVANAFLGGIHSMSGLETDPAFGGAASLSASFGPDLVALDSALFARGMPGVVHAGFRLLDAGIGRLWIFDFADSSGNNAIRAGWGGDSVVLEIPGARRASALPSDSKVHSIALEQGVDTWRLLFDGAILIELPVSSGPAGKQVSWTRRVVGRGGGVALGELVVLTKNVNRNDASLLAGHRGVLVGF